MSLVTGAYVIKDLGFRPASVKPKKTRRPAESAAIFAGSLRSVGYYEVLLKSLSFDAGSLQTYRCGTSRDPPPSLPAYSAAQASISSSQLP